MKVASIAAPALSFLGVWGACAAYLAAAGADWVFPVFALAIFALVLPGVGLAATRGSLAAAPAVARPARESAAIACYLVAYAVGFLGFGMSALRETIAEGRAQEIAVLAAKLIAHVVLPAIVLAAAGARLSPLFASRMRAAPFWRTLIIIGVLILLLLMIISPSLKRISETGADAALLAFALPASFAWVAVEAGLNEEFLFRAVLQTRLEAWLRSPAWGVAIASLLFGLAHAPGLYLRGGGEQFGAYADPLQVVAYCVATLAPAGVFFGVVYARTRSLLLVVLLHAMVDVLPNTADFIRIWMR